MLFKFGEKIYLINFNYHAHSGNRMTKYDITSPNRD